MHDGESLCGVEDGLHDTNIVSNFRFVSVRDAKAPDELWGERVDDLTGEGLCELTDEEDGELGPRDRRLIVLAAL